MERYAALIIVIILFFLILSLITILRVINYYKKQNQNITQLKEPELCLEPTIPTNPNHITIAELSAKFNCSSKGDELERCPHCGELTSINSSVCHYCGKSI